MSQKVTPFLMFNNQLEEALALYTRIFPDTEARNVVRDGVDGPVRSAEFRFGTQTFFAYNGGEHFKFSDAFSMFVHCEDQAEVDRYWEALVHAGAKPVQCGWITDPFGLSWQIVPKRFMELLRDPDPKKVQAVVAVMLTQTKLELPALEQAYAAVPSDRAAST